MTLPAPETEPILLEMTSLLANNRIS